MTETATIDKVYNEIVELRGEVDFIKKHMFDPDCIMTAEEEERYEEAMKELKEGKTISLEDLKKELGI